jgi:hypothetical protein
MKRFYVVLFVIAISALAVAAQDRPRTVQLDKPTAERYLSRLRDNALPPAPTGSVPASVIYATGSSYTGITVHGFNAIDLPDGTVMVGTKSSFGGNQELMGAVQFGGTFPAGAFRYPFENGKRGEWTEQPNVLVYQLYTFFPNGDVSMTTAYKDFNKYWAGQIGVPRMISGGSSSVVNGELIITLTATIGTGPAIAVVIKDVDVDYNQTAIPQSAIRRQRNQIIINATAAGYQYAANGEIVVMVANGTTGASDQYVVRGPIELVVFPAAK